MRLRDLTKCYIYSVTTIKIHGESIKRWTYKGEYDLNVQQDLNELDKNQAGLIDYNIIKIRTDYDYPIEKNDYISFTQLTIVDGYTTTSPEYRVENKIKVGTTTTYTCNLFNGELYTPNIEVGGSI